MTVVARRAGGGGRSAGDVRHGADARADRRAVGRSRRDGAAAAGHGRRRTPSSASTASRAAGCRRSRRSSRSTSRATRSPPRTTTPAGCSSTSSRSRASARCAAACNMRPARRLAERHAARSPPRKGPERTQNYNGGFGGSLIKQKASFSINVNGIDVSSTRRTYYVCTPAARWSKALALRRPRDNVVRLRPVRLRDHARPDAARQLQPATARRRSNLGIGGYDLPERGYSTARITTTRCGSRRPGRSAAASSSTPARRLSWSRHRHRTSLFEAPTIRVIDAFTSGGAQAAGGTRREDDQPAVGSRLRARHPFGAHRRRSSTAAPITPTTRRTTSAPTRSRASTAYRRRHAAQLHAAHRRSEHRLQQRPGAASTCRTTSASART